MNFCSADVDDYSATSATSSTVSGWSGCVSAGASGWDEDSGSDGSLTFFCFSPNLSSPLF
jgi:hypothetical protein